MAQGTAPRCSPKMHGGTCTVAPVCGPRWASAMQDLPPWPGSTHRNGGRVFPLSLPLSLKTTLNAPNPSFPRPFLFGLGRGASQSVPILFVFVRIG